MGSADFASFVRVRFNYCGKAIPKTDRRICGWPVIKAIGRQYQAHQHQLKAIGAGRKSPCRAILAFREGRKVFKTTDRLGTHWGTVPLLYAREALRNIAFGAPVTLPRGSLLYAQEYSSDVGLIGYALG